MELQMMKRSDSRSVDPTRDKTVWVSGQSVSPSFRSPSSWDRRWESPERSNSKSREKLPAIEATQTPTRRFFQTVSEFEKEERTVLSLINTVRFEIELLKNKRKKASKKSAQDTIDVSLNLAKAKHSRLREVLTELRGHRNMNSSRYTVPLKPPFCSSDVRHCQKPPPMSDSPNFYKNGFSWDFGYDNREKSLDMGAFKHASRLQDDRDEETLGDVSILTGIRSNRARLRPTDYEGLIYKTAAKLASSPPVIDRYGRMSSADTVGRNVPMSPSPGPTKLLISPPETIGYGLGATSAYASRLATPRTISASTGSWKSGNNKKLFAGEAAAGTGGGGPAGTGGNMMMSAGSQGARSSPGINNKRVNTAVIHG